MAVYKFRTMDALTDALKDIARKLIADLRVTLSPEEFITAFIQPEHVSPLQETERLVGMAGDTNFMTKVHTSDGLPLYARVNFGHNRPPIIIPEYAKMGFANTIPEDLKSKVTAAIDERFRIGKMFGDAIDALHYLNEHSGNAAAMAVLFPALPMLLAATDPDPNSANAKRATRLATMKSFGTVATLPREVRLRILECSGLITNTSMLDDRRSIPDLKAREAGLYINRPVDDLPDFIWQSRGETQDGSFV